MSEKTNTPEIYLPPYSVESCITTLSEVVDYGLIMTGVRDAWQITEGEGITVMVIDSGYSPHDDLKDAMLIESCKSFVKEGKGTVEDLGCGHSNHCMGIIGARKNGIGLIGVAPKCNLISVKVFDKSGTGGFKSINDALDYAIQTRPDIVSMSLGSDSPDVDMENKLQTLNDLNIPVICAAGNSGRDNDVNYPGKYPSTIAVGAIDQDGNIAEFSSRGDEVSFVAAGSDVYSCWLNNKYAKLSGTSMACPFMAGVVALLLAKHKKQEETTGLNDCVTVEQVREHLIKYADRNGAVVKDAAYGYGMVNVAKAIAEEADNVTPVEAVKPLGFPWNPTHLVLDEDYIFDSGKRGVNMETSDGVLSISDGVWTIKKGFEWDGTSCVWDGEQDPNKPPFPVTWEGSLVHDIGYRYLRNGEFKGLYVKSDIDSYLRQLLHKVNFKYAELYYWGVRLFGRWALLFGKIKHRIGKS